LAIDVLKIYVLFTVCTVRSAKIFAKISYYVANAFVSFLTLNNHDLEI